MDAWSGPLRGNSPRRSYLLQDSLVGDRRIRRDSRQEGADEDFIRPGSPENSLVHVPAGQGDPRILVLGSAYKGHLGAF